MEVLRTICVYLVILLHPIWAGLDRKDVKMCNSSTEIHRLQRLWQDDSQNLFSTEEPCVCKITRKEKEHVIFGVQEFKCSIQYCDKKLKYYVDGCFRHEVCCEENTREDEIFLMKKYDSGTDIHIVLETSNNYTNSTVSLQVLVNVNIMGRGDDEWIETSCGLAKSNWSNVFKSAEECKATKPPTTITTIFTSGADDDVTVTETIESTEQITSNAGRPYNSKFTFRQQLAAVIGGCVASIIIILTVVISIAVCKSRERPPEEDEERIDGRDTGVVYSYTRTLPKKDPDDSGDGILPIRAYSSDASKGSSPSYPSEKDSESQILSVDMSEDYQPRQNRLPRTGPLEIRPSYDAKPTPSPQGHNDIPYAYWNQIVDDEFGFINSDMYTGTVNPNYT